MLDIQLFRVDQGGNPDLVRESQRRRYADVGLVDAVIEIDSSWRETRGQLDDAKKAKFVANAVGAKADGGDAADAKRGKGGGALPASSLHASLRDDVVARVEQIVRAEATGETDRAQRLLGKLLEWYHGRIERAEHEGRASKAARLRAEISQCRESVAHAFARARHAAGNWQGPRHP